MFLKSQNTGYIGVWETVVTEVQLTGEFQHTLDSKGRVNFPAKLRELLGTTFMICKGLGDPCLAVYSLEQWEQLSEKINRQPMAKAKRLQRFLFSGAALAEPDKQGRVLIPQNLRDYAQLQKELVIIGAGDRAEIWDLARWNETLCDMSAEQIGEDLADLEF